MRTKGQADTGLQENGRSPLREDGNAEESSVPQGGCGPMSPSPGAWPLTLLVKFASAWCVFATLELILNAFMSGSVLYSMDLPLSMRLSAVSYDLVALTAAFVVIAGPSTLLAALVRR